MLKLIRSCLLLCAFLLIGCPCTWAADSSHTLPNDIDPVSLCRLPMIYKQDLDADGKRVFEFIAGKETDTPNIGPVNVSLYNPKIAEAMQMLNQEVRYHSVIGRRYTELAILVVSREFDQQYEWSMHEKTARDEGIPGAVIDTVKYNRRVKGLNPQESLIIRFGRQLMRKHKLDSKLFAESVQLFGRRGTVELAAIMGDYLLGGILLHAVDQHLAKDWPPLLPVDH